MGIVNRKHKPNKTTGVVVAVDSFRGPAGMVTFCNSYAADDPRVSATPTAFRRFIPQTPISDHAGDGQLVVATTGLSFRDLGLSLGAGEVIPADHPAVATAPDAFRPWNGAPTPTALNYDERGAEPSRPGLAVTRVGSLASLEVIA